MSELGVGQQSARAASASDAVAGDEVVVRDQDLFASIEILIETQMEYGFSAENERQWDLRAADLSVFELVEVASTDLRLAVGLQRELAKAGLVKRKVPDLIIAAVAINHGLTLVHYHSDFEFIATVSALKHTWIVARGSTD